MTRGSKVSPVRICIVTVSHLAVGRAAARDDDVARVLSGLVLEDHRTHYVEIETVALAQANRLGVDVHGNRASSISSCWVKALRPQGLYGTRAPAGKSTTMISIPLAAS